MEGRSYEPITGEHLERLAEIARLDRTERFRRRPRWRPYDDRILCTALCQGAALHFLDKRNGVKDFDVYTFYAEATIGPFPARWRLTADFGESHFGRYEPDPLALIGRRVDLIGRSLPVAPGVDPVEAVREYLRGRRTSTARHLASKAVIGVDPPTLRGRIIWPEGMASPSP
jgi:hypothetical protein